MGDNETAAMLLPEEAVDVPATTPAREPMSEEDLEKLVKDEIEQAISYIDTEIGPSRTLASQYHKGAPFGDEESGRSTVVSRDVHDVVNALMPSLMRVFFGPERVAEFVPVGAEDVAMAEQATDYIDYVVKNDNPGFLTLYSAFKDALIRKTGIIKFWWDESVEIKREALSGLDEESVALLMSEVDAAPDTELDLTQDPATGLIGGEIRRQSSKGLIRIAALPPEDFLICADAPDLDRARYCGHRAEPTVSDLVAMGYDYEWVLEQSGVGSQFNTNPEKLERNKYAASNEAGSVDDAMRRVLFIESYVLVDFDGDGIAELRRIDTVGEKYAIGKNEAVSIRPFADFCPDPEPHTFFGESAADVVMDLQRVKSAIWRNMMDSLAQSIHARLAVVEGQCNMADVLNNEVGGPIRMSAQGMVFPLTTPFVGKEAFPMLDYCDLVKESRTGISRAAAGLDADALQSTTKAAVAATVTAANQHIELIARIFAETGMKRLFRGILSLLVTHQQKERVIKLRNKWVPMNPASWRSDMDVVVNVAVGAGTLEERELVLEKVIGKQEAILQLLGPSNPIVTVAQYRNTLAKAVEMAGFKDSAQFFQPVDPNAQSQGGGPAAQPPQDPAAMLLAQVESKKIDADIAIAQGKLAVEREKMLREDDRERDKLDADIALRARELEMKYMQTVDVASIRAAVDRDRNAAQARGGA